MHSSFNIWVCGCHGKEERRQDPWLCVVLYAVLHLGISLGLLSRTLHFYSCSFQLHHSRMLCYIRVWWEHQTP